MGLWIAVCTLPSVQWVERQPVSKPFSLLAALLLLSAEIFFLFFFFSSVICRLLALEAPACPDMYQLIWKLWDQVQGSVLVTSTQITFMDAKV